MTHDEFLNVRVGDKIAACDDYGWPQSGGKVRQLLTKFQLYTVLVAKYDSDLVKIVNDEQSEMWFDATVHFIIVTVTQSAQPALGIPLLMTYVEFLKLVPGDVVTAALTWSGLTIGNKYTITGLNVNQDLLWINDDTGMQQCYRYDRFASITSTYVFPKVSVKAKPELSEFELMKKDLTERNSTEPACRCSSPQVHDSDCAWFKWRHKS